MTLRIDWRVFVACWSLSNIVFLEQWQRLLRLEDPEFSFFVTTLSPSSYWALIANVLLCAIAAWGLVSLIRRSEKKWVRTGSIVLLAVAFVYVVNSLRRETVGALSPAIPSAAASMMIVILLLAIAIVGRGRAITGLGLLLSPFLAFTHLQAAKILIATDMEAVFAPEPVRDAAASDNPGRRLAVIVFDEADYRIMFESRPEGIELPNFDRLTMESLHAMAAVPPAGSTEFSIPSLLTGLVVDGARPLSARDVELDFADDAVGSAKLGATETLFASLAGSGARIGVAGWSLPYCRLPGLALTKCFARGMFTPPAGFARAMAWQFCETARVGPLLDREHCAGLPYHTRDYLEVMANAKAMIGSRDLDLVWIHLPVPHGPRIYDRETGTFVGPQLHSPRSYPDNLVLADLALGQLRSELARTGLDRTTSLIVTSDHSYRSAHLDGETADPRVPFIVRLASNPFPLDHGLRFNTVVLKSLAEAIMSGDVQTPIEASLMLSPAG